MTSIKDILNLSNKNYANYISNLLREEDAIYLIDEIDDQLIEIVNADPAEVERICKINSAVFKQSTQDELRNHILAYNYNTLMIAIMNQNNFTESKSVFIEGISFCQENLQYGPGKSLSQNIFHLFESSQIPVDEAPFYLSKINEFYKALGKHEDSIIALCTAANYFADASAFQSAYRAIHDAQQIASSNPKLIRSQIRILETQGMVALTEGDLDSADTEFEKCFKIYKAINETPAFELTANAALVKMRRGEYESAKDIYEPLLNVQKGPSEYLHISQIKINLLVCYRELGDIKSLEDLSQQIESDIAGFNLEVRIEARLILAKTYFQINRDIEGTKQLKAACIDVQQQVDQYQRLHYRRGVREQYVRRIKHMLLCVSDSGVASEIMHILTLCCSNALLDWLSVLDWAENVQQSKTVPDSSKKQLSSKIKNLVDYGTPFLYGFREKYDDPFEQANGELAEKVGESTARALDYSLPWREFNDLTSQICQENSLPSPFEGATIQNSTNLLGSKQASTAFLFSITTKDACIIIFIIEGKYLKTEISTKSVLQFFQALYGYQRLSIDRPAFHTELYAIQKEMEPAMNKIVDAIANSSILEVIFVPDYFTEGLPILASLLVNDHIRLRIKDSRFTFRNCPALKEQLLESSSNGPGIFISNSDERLELSESEKSIVKRAFAGQTFTELDLKNDKLDFSQSPLNESFLLHMSTHSSPANKFTDPMFVSTSTDISKNSIWLESVQRESNNLQLMIVFLNGCNTGTTSNSNYFKQFFTNEKVGLSSVFLLNRKCSVIATQWNEPESISYIFSVLFYKRLCTERTADRSFILALLDLYELTKEDTIALLSEIVDEGLREQKSNLYRNSPSSFPFRNTYILGMFQCFSLLSKNST